MNSFRFCLASLLLALCAASSATAQSWAYPDWPEYDSTFYVGSDVAANVDVAMDELTIDYHWGYLEFIADFISRYQNPGNVGNLAHREFVLAAKERGFKIIAGPHDLRALIDNAPVMENYPGGAAEWLRSITGVRLPGLYDVNESYTDYKELDDRKIFYTLTAPAGSGTQFMAGRPAYSINAMRLGDPWLFDSIGSADYSRDVRLSMKLFTDITNPVFDSLADADTIAFMIVFRRYTGSEQSDTTCRCDFWERFDTIAVTKLGYLNGDIDGVNGFSEVGTYYKLDSLASSLRGDSAINPDGQHWFGWWLDKPVFDSLRYDTITVQGQSGDSTFIDTVEVFWDSNIDTCNAIYATLDSDRIIRSGLFPNSDIDLRVYTTGRVPIQLLRTKVNMRFYDQLIAGQADGMVANVVGAMVADTVLDATTWKISISNEIQPFWEPRAYGYVSSVLQREIAAHNRTWQLHTNPYTDYAGLRALSGDLDSVTGTKILHSLVPQPYGTPMVPEMYADTARMDSVAEAVHFKDLIAFNTLADYQTYTVANSSGPYFLNGINRETWGGDWVSAVDVARFRYRHFAPSMPVYPSVQAQGYYEHDTSGTITRIFGMASPEFAKSRLWYALSTGADGIHLADVSFHQNNYGYVFARSGDHSADTLEYGSVEFFNSTVKTPYMWLGIPSRFDTIKNTIQAIRYIDTLIGWKNLIYNQEQMTVNDTNQWFDWLPLIDTVTARHAQRYTLDGSGNFVDSTATDAKESTFFEVTHFASGPGDTTVTDHGNAHYYLIVNKRTWPLDTRIHDTINGVPRVRTPLGYIDARKPILRFASPDALRPDTAIIEGVLSGFRDTVLFGEMAELSWLKPGSAELYRVTVLPAGISEHSTAYNNSVHSENPSTGQEMLDQVVVYERDSVVYVRTVDPLGSWSRELMISDPADTVITGGKRTASNFFPAVALLRDGSARARFVWERDSLGYRSVVTAFIDGADGVSRSTIDSVHLGEYTVVRHRASVADSLVGPPALTPSIVAVRPTDTTAGFILSWADHAQGINLLALRPAPIDDTLRVADSVGIYGIRRKGSGSPGNVGQYPTLATVDRREWVDFLTSTISGPEDVDSTGGTHPAYPTNASWTRIHLTHLAWQQGDGVDGDGEQIYYSRVGSIFPYNTSIRPTLVIVWSIEHVSKQIQACSFEHPSIAADSVRVGVAFEIHRQTLNPPHIGLRFRDTAAINPTTGLPLRDWETYVYRFGRVLRPGIHYYGSDRSVRPSLTHFPAMDSVALAADPHGGLTWFWTNEPGGRKYPQYLYRYGWFEPREIGDGAHPSLTLVPLRRFGAFENTSILHRGPNATRAVGENDEGQNVWYYTGHLLNTAGNPLPALFNTGAETGNIIGNVTLMNPGAWFGCVGIHERRPSYGIEVAFPHGDVTHPPDDRHGPGDPIQITTTPGLPPTFFRTPGNGATVVADLDDATRIVRTSLFIANEQPVTIIRGASAADSTAEWLNTFADDLERGCKADIWSVVELVRASDSVVLWRGDTISARGLDTNDIDSVSHEVSVPVGTYTDSGEIVFIQVRPFASSSVIYEVGGGFAFHAEQIGGGAPKAARRSEGETGAALLQLSLVPNPVHDGRTTLHVGTELVGRIEIDVWNVNGRRVGTLPSIDADRAGTYSVELDLEGVRPGSYLVRAYAVEAERSVTVRLTVVE